MKTTVEAISKFLILQFEKHQHTLAIDCEFDTLIEYPIKDVIHVMTDIWTMEK